VYVLHFILYTVVDINILVLLSIKVVVVEIK